jgi:hypothetical protein
MLLVLEDIPLARLLSRQIGRFLLWPSQRTLLSTLELTGVISAALPRLVRRPD